MPTPPRTDAAPIALDALIAALKDPATYPYEPESIEIVQTHISVVALAPPYVYKIKKPVDFGFLDFSTLEQRQHFCAREIELNRRLCADIYERVVPISRVGDGLRLERDANPVEVAVKMRMLDPEHFLHHQLNRGALSTDDLDRVMDRLEAFYAERAPSAEVAAAGRTARIKENTDENFAQAADHVGTLLSEPAFETIRYATDRFLDHHARLLNERRAGGCIINGHGDLRLEHIHCTPERVCIYDCIEFNDRFRHLDVANDLAFLAMDLDTNGRADLSRYIIRAMSRRLGDPDLPLLADFYKSYRAFVRGKVAGLRSEDPEIPETDRAASQDEARRLYQWALRYGVAGSKPMVVIVMGRVGTGKSTQAQALGDALGWPVASSDRVRKSLAGVPVHERADAETRKQLYAEAMTAKTYAALFDRAEAQIEAGEGIVLDATFSKRRHRDALRERLQTVEGAHVFVELTAPDSVIQQRLDAREQSPEPEQASDARREDFDMLSSRYEAPDALEDPFHIHASAQASPTATTTDILKHLARLAPEPG